MRKNLSKSKWGKAYQNQNEEKTFKNRNDDEEGEITGKFFFNLQADMMKKM